MPPDQDSPCPKVPPGQPNPVLVGPGMKTLGEDAYKGASTVTPNLDVDQKHPVINDAPTYFSDIPGDKDSVASPTSPAEAAKNAKSPRELLRRMSLMGSSFPDLHDAEDPRQQYPGLKLTGRIISAAFCIPYKLHYRPGSEWVWMSC